MDWLSINDSLNSIRGQISNFASNVLTDKGNDTNHNQKEVKDTHELQQSEDVPDDANNVCDSWDWDQGEEDNANKDQQNSDLQKKVLMLEKENREFISKLEELDFENQQNLSEMMHIKDELQKNLNELNEQYENLKSKYKKSKEKAHLKINELEKKVDELKILNRDLIDSKNFKSELQQINNNSYNISNENCAINPITTDSESVSSQQLINEENNCSVIRESYEEQIHSLKTELKSLKVQNEQLQINRKEARNSRVTDVQNGQNYPEVLHNDVSIQVTEKDVSEFGNIVNIIIDNLEKMSSCDKISDMQINLPQDCPRLEEMIAQIENITAFIIELKTKNVTLIQQMSDLSEGHVAAINDKCDQIEKLIANSKQLSQEISEKDEIIKSYDNEMNELSNNNEELIHRLEIYNNTNLQTISESNEDNMLLLESQLENAYKRIDELEKIIIEGEHQKVSLFAPQNLEEKKNGTELEISKRESDYQELLNNFNELHLETNALKESARIFEENFEQANEENIQLKSELEKVKTEYENLDYQLSELNINLDSLKEENLLNKKNMDILVKENDELHILIEKKDNSIKKLTEEINKKDEELVLEQHCKQSLQDQIKQLTEKLQNYKMLETSSKLQFDNLNKEVIALAADNRNLEESLRQANLDTEDYRSKCLNVEDSYSKLLEENNQFNQILLEKEKQIEHLENQISQLHSVTSNNDNDMSKSLVNNSFDSMPMADKKLVDPDDVVNSIPLENSAILTVDLKLEIEKLIDEKKKLEEELERILPLQDRLEKVLQSEAALQQQIQEITNSRNELINIVTTKHQESITYHKEVQRLTAIMNTETEKFKNLETQIQQLNSTIEKFTDENNFLKEKCDILSKNLLLEQKKNQELLSKQSLPSEKELTLQKNLDRLQAHLVEIEEHYTQELLQCEQKNVDLQARLSELEEREKSSNTVYTSVSIRANQQVEYLQNQLQILTNERDSLRKKISEAEDEHGKQSASLANLQFVLEQFRRDKEKDVQRETERIRRHINVEKQAQEELKKEISNLKYQLEESKKGLLAASRLSDQLEYSKKSILTLKEEVNQLQDKLTKKEEELKNITMQTDGKVDKLLIKNLFIGFISSNKNLNQDQLQILKIISSVLDFNSQDQERINLNKQSSSWLKSFLNPQYNEKDINEESLSRAFIKFLENESKPRVVPSLLNSSSESSSPTVNKPSTSRQSPLVLNEIALPTFADFAQNRNSSSILKDVLKDSS